MRDKLIRACISVPVFDEFIYFLVNVHARFKNKDGSQNENKISHQNDEAVWFLKIAAPRNASAENWEDLAFAKDLAHALDAKGIASKLLFRGENVAVSDNDVVLVIRGLVPVKPNSSGINVLWVISHPEQVSNRELTKFDYIFAASEKWAKEKSAETGIAIRTLLQATDPRRFQPNKSDASPERKGIVFVGNSVGRKRQVVLDVVSLGFAVEIYGKGWEDKVPAKYIKAQKVAYSELPKIYQSARVVLNDHWPDMLENGFISNRIFDAVQAGATVISDKVPGTQRLFGTNLLTYVSLADLKSKLEKCLDEPGEKPVDELLFAAQFGKQNSFDERLETMLDVITEGTRPPSNLILKKFLG